MRPDHRFCTVSSTSKPATGAPPRSRAANDILSAPQKPDMKPQRAATGSSVGSLAFGSGSSSPFMSM